MRAVQIIDLTGPDSALKLVDIPEPEPSHPLTPGSGVVVDVHAAGVSFPEVLQTRGEYQFKPPLPFVPGCEVAGVVRSAPEGASVSEGDRVAACIAAASVIAKVTRDRIMCRLHERYPAYDFETHKGYITPEHTEALERHGPCPIHRRRFVNVRRAFGESGGDEEGVVGENEATWEDAAMEVGR